MGLIRYPPRFRPDEYEHPRNYNLMAYFNTVLRAFREQKRNRRRKKLPPENIVVEATLVRRMFGLLVYIADLEEHIRDEKAQHKSIAESLDRERATLEERVGLWLLWKSARSIRSNFIESHRDSETGKLLWPTDLVQKIQWRRFLRRFKDIGKMPSCIKVAIREHLRRNRESRKASSCEED